MMIFLWGGGTLQALYGKMCDNNIALVAGINYRDNILFDGKLDNRCQSIISSVIGLKKFWRKDGYVLHGSVRGRYAAGISETTRTEWAMGYFFCVKKSLCVEYNIRFDENLIRYAYAEDLDFSYRYCRVARKLGKDTILDPTLYVNHLASKEWRTPSREATFYAIINRRYLSYKLFPGQFWNRWLLEWSDICWELVGCKTKEEKKNFHDARVKCWKYRKDLKVGNLNAIYE